MALETYDGEKNEDKKELETYDDEKYIDDKYKEILKMTEDKELKKPEEKKKSFLKQLWNKTIFPDKIKEKKEEKRWKAQIKKEVREEAKEEIKKQIKEDMIKKEVERMKTGKGGKIMKGLKAIGDDLSEGFKGTRIGSTDKINEMLGRGTNSAGSERGKDLFSSDNITKMMGRGNQQEEVKETKKRKAKKGKKKKNKQPQTQQTKERTTEDRIKDLLS